MNRLKNYLNRLYHSLGFSKKIYVAGDSHTSVFHYINFNKWFSPFYFEIKTVHGATASGIKNPNSQTKAMSKFDDFIKSSKKKKKYLLFQLGEVDCGFVIWYRCGKKNISVEKQLEETIRNYQAYILSKEKYVSNVIIMSAVLPTIKDGQHFGEVANKRKEVKASLKDRTLLTMAFNQAMKEFSNKHNFYFLDFDQVLLNPNSQTVYDHFLNENPLDHHLSNEKFAPIILNRLREL